MIDPYSNDSSISLKFVKLRLLFDEPIFRSYSSLNGHSYKNTEQSLT